MASIFDFPDFLDRFEIRNWLRVPPHIHYNRHQRDATLYSPLGLRVATLYSLFGLRVATRYSLFGLRVAILYSCI